MIKGCKICGISDPKTLTYIVDHPHPPQFVGFIVNWKASSRYVCLLYTSPSPRDRSVSRMPSSA